MGTLQEVDMTWIVSYSQEVTQNNIAYSIRAAFRVSDRWSTPRIPLILRFKAILLKIAAFRNKSRPAIL